MSEEKTILEQIAQVRTAMIQLLDQISEKVGAYAFPEMPPRLADYRKQLVANDSQVLVVGEAKRGKSSFINALIGRDILPVDVDIATSQVFRVRNAPQEAYRLRFEDGSAQVITAADLAMYGSQVIADRGDSPGLAQVIRWIEVDVPTHFLPAGISLLDTPGLGALYAAHAQITYRFVPYADAVIFVLDSLQPILETELKFIETLLKVTSNIFFIQTKIDTQNEEEWSALQRRNTEILHTRFPDRLAHAQIWPVSSLLLLNAITEQGDDEDYLAASLHPALAAALQLSLFRAAGWEQSAQALTIVEHYYRTVRSLLAERLTGLNRESEQQNIQHQQKIAQRKRAFELAWGESGTEKVTLVAQIRAINETKQQAFMRQLQRNNAIEQAERRKIDGIESLKEATAYSNTMADHVVGLFMEAWRQTWQETRQECRTILTRFFVAADALNAVVDTDETSILLQGAPQLVNGDIAAQVKEQVMTEATTIGGVLSILSQLFGSLLLEEEAYREPDEQPMNMLHPITGLATACYIAVRGLILKGNMELEGARKTLHQYLTDVLEAVRNQFISRDLGNGYQNRVENFYASLERAISSDIEQIVARKSKELRFELAQLDETTHLSTIERVDRIALLQQQMDEWQAFGPTIKQIAQSLKQLNVSLPGWSRSGE